jgi:membrane protease subunit HflC
MTPKKTFILTLVVVVLLVVLACFFTVQEGQQAMVARLGKLVLNDEKTAHVFQPGLHFKLPLVDNVLKFDTRLQTLDVESFRIPTQEQKDVIVDYYVKWQISNLPLYYARTTGQIFLAEKLLEQQVNDDLRAEFGRKKIKEVVSDARTTVMTALSEKANKNAQKLGLSVVDVRVKRIDLPEEVSSAVFGRMRTDRERVAKEQRAEGKSKSEAIRAQADANAVVILAKAQADANQIRAEGDSAAAKIYADAYNQNPDFYEFYRSLFAYVKTFDSPNNILLLSTDSQFFKYFNSSTGAQKK